MPYLAKKMGLPHLQEVHHFLNSFQNIGFFHNVFLNMNLNDLIYLV